MRLNRFFAVALAVLWASPALAQAVPSLSSVIGTCGTASYVAGQNRSVTQDTTGKACVDAIITLPAPLDTNLARVGGVATSVGSGASDSGTQRVTLSNDAASTIALPTGAATSDLQSSVQGTAGSPTSAVLTMQGVSGGTPVPVSVNAVDPVTPVETSAAASSLVISATAANLSAVYAQASTTNLWLMLFDATSAPGNGAVTPTKCYLIPAGTDRSISWNGGPPLHFTTGIVAVTSSTGCYTKTASNAVFISGEAQ